MKKHVFCVLFALLISISALAAAESTSCCACCSFAASASSDNAPINDAPIDDAIANDAIAGNAPFDDPLADSVPEDSVPDSPLVVELDGVTIYLPPEYESLERYGAYVTEDTLFLPSWYVRFREDGDAYYEDLNEWRRVWEKKIRDSYSDNVTTRILYVDGLAAFTATTQESGRIIGLTKVTDGYTCVSLNISNREKWFVGSIYSEHPETAEQLAEYVVQHIVFTNTTAE